MSSLRRTLELYFARLECRADLSSETTSSCFWVFCAVASFLVLLGSPQTAQARQQESLNVTVKDSSTEVLLGGAKVELRQDGQILSRLTTTESGTAVFDVTVVSSEEVPEYNFQLGVPYPNPASDRTSIPLSLNRSGPVSIGLYDLLGRQVVATTSVLPAGDHEVDIGLGGLATGTYIARITADGRAYSRSFIRGGFGGQIPEISVRSTSRGAPITTAAKGSTSQNEYQLHISKEGYLNVLFYISLPDDENYTAWMHEPRDITNSIGTELIRIPAGTFRMGWDGSNLRNGPAHVVTLTHDFWMGRYEVTQREYHTVIGEPSIGDEVLPKGRISWVDAISFSNALSMAEGLPLCYDSNGNVHGDDIYLCEGYRLPTEAEWEYAVRAGSTTNFFFGDDDSQLEMYAWCSTSYDSPVGLKLPNPWGLYDVYGNAPEWASDWYGESYYSTSPSSNPPGPTSGSQRVRRGLSSGCGRFASPAASWVRENGLPTYHGAGLRLARTAKMPSINSAPQAPSGSSPADGATTVSLTPPLFWTSGDVDEDVLECDVYFGSATSPPLQSSGSCTEGYFPSQLMSNTSYYWQIVVRDGNGSEVSGPVWTFSTTSDSTAFTTTTNSIGMHLIRIPVGTFRMGSHEGPPNERPVHEVTLTNAFWIGKFEVTQGEYRAITGESPSYFTGDDRLPVESVSVYDAIAFTNALSRAEGLSPCYDSSGSLIDFNIYVCSGYRLPTEAEWEYAARAGTMTPFSFGYNWRTADSYEWYDGNAGSRSHAVGEQQPNPWGLYDMHGNVMEWLHDWHSDSYYSTSLATNPSGPIASVHRAVRGGSWSLSHDFLRSAKRGYGWLAYRDENHVGFRLARTVQ